MHKEGRSYSHEAILPRMKVENCSQLLFQTASTSATTWNTDSSAGWRIKKIWSCSDQLCPRDERHDWFGRHRSPGADRQRWESVEMTKPIIGVEVDKLRKFNPATQKLWGIRFEKSTNVKFQCKKEVANLDATILTVEPALALVGGSSKDADEAQPTRPKRKLFQCSYCVRSFSEEEKLVQPSMQSTLTSNTNNYVL